MEYEVNINTGQVVYFNPPNIGMQDMTPLFIPAAPALDSLFGWLGSKISGLFGDTAGAGTTTLYRAVMPNELADIEASNVLQNTVGNEVKYFSTTAEGAASYGQQAAKAFGDGPFTIVQSSIPTSAITTEMQVVVDGGIQTVVVPTELLPKMSQPIILPSTPLPAPPAASVLTR